MSPLPLGGRPQEENDHARPDASRLHLPRLRRLLRLRAFGRGSHLPVVVTGTLLGPTGQAVASAPVSLEREPQSPFAGHLAGEGCDPDATYGTFLTGQTDASGAYDFSLAGSDTQSSDADALCFRIRDSQGSLAAAVAFDVQVDQVLLPALQLFDPQLGEANEGQGAGALLSFTWTSPARQRTRRASRS